MATSGTTGFTLDLTEIIDEAFERAGAELRTGYDYRTARRSIDLMMREWETRGLNLWQVDPGTQALTAGTATYTMPAGTIDFIEQQIRYGSGVNQVDYNLTRMSVSTWAQQSHKNLTGRPTMIYIDRQASPEYTLWPIPDSNDYTLAYWRLRRIEDTGAKGSNTMDVPDRFLPALTAGLAYHLAMKIPGGEKRVAALESAYEKQFDIAADDDRDRASVRFIPSIRRI